MGFKNWGLDHAPEIDLSSAAIAPQWSKVLLVFGTVKPRGSRWSDSIIEPNHLHLNEPFFGNIGSGYQTNGRGCVHQL